MLATLKHYVLLPEIVTSFEDDYLKRMNRVAGAFLMAHLPFMVALAFFNDTDPRLAAVLTAAVLLGPVMACKLLESRRRVSMVHGVASMLMGGLLVHFGQGPVQIEMHFYFFVLLALLVVFANPMVIIAAAATVTLHHAIMWVLLPSSVLNYAAPFWVVGVHAAFVVLESVAACFIARVFFDNVIELEKIVEQRTAQLEARNQDILTILDSVEEGFLTIDRGGTIATERSAAVEKLLGPVQSDDSLKSVLARHDTTAAEWFELALEEVFHGALPTEVTVDQLPTQIVAFGRSLSIRYFPVTTNEKLKMLTVVVTDNTAEVEKQKLEAESRELLTLLEKIRHDRHGFTEFFQSTEKVFEEFRSEENPDPVIVQRRLHTLKGNSSVFGLFRLADACHLVEDHIAEFGFDMDSEAWANLFMRWANVRNLLCLVGDCSCDKYRISEDEYSELLLGLLGGMPHDLLVSKVAAWKLDPVEQRLQQLAAQVNQIAKRLGKGDVHVEIESNDLRTEGTSWSEFWCAMVHVIRNAVDHGLESSEDRCLASKPRTGRLTIKTDCLGDKFVVSVADDGRGVDWDRVAKLARERGLPASTNADLVNAIFADGFSTQNIATETSGRGVGLAALKHECEELGGEIEVLSTRGEGTEFRFTFPMESMAPQLYGLMVSHGIQPDLVEMVAA